MDKSDITLERMRTFVRIAERGSLTLVAKEIGSSQSSVTRRLRELEDGLGVSLLSRTTRSVTLTDEGAKYYAHCIRILRLVELARDEIHETRDAHAGTIRVSCSAAIGVMHISRLIFAFQDRFPDIRVDLSLNDEQVDLVRAGIDFSIRLGPLSDSSMKLKSLGQSQRLLVASSDYLAQRGHPEKPEDLIEHEPIRMSNISGSETLTLKSVGGETHSIPWSGRLRVDHGLAAREAAVAGRGIAPAHLWLVSDLLASGALEVVLSNYVLPSVPLSLLIAPDRSQLARVRLLADFLARQARLLPGIG
ncbi:LysR family transcriptional regulator [Labrenzia sp. CE80]|uniref:LysR family transcriptional regulator n=1 Tax=Labrenzia sp. CE80 TaxID=1788986 RepID=UPI00129BBC32|nr:LysR family transcriptional regulator [Labrenzia sp. CE80]